MMHWKPRGVKADIDLGGSSPLSVIKKKVGQIMAKSSDAKKIANLYNNRLRRFRNSSESNTLLLENKLREYGYNLTKGRNLSAKNLTRQDINKLDFLIPKTTQEWEQVTAPGLILEEKMKQKVAFEAELKNRLSSAFDDLLGEYYENQEGGDRVVNSKLQNSLSDEELIFLEKDMINLGRAYRNGDMSVEDIWSEIARIKGMKGV